MLAQLYSRHELNIIGVIPSAGNSTLKNTVRNALQIGELTDRTDVKVYPGASVPIGQTENEMENAAGAHGLTGFGKVKLPEPSLKAEEINGVEFAVEALKCAEEAITIISTGGLTDLYHTLERLQKEDSEALRRISAIFMMGGVFDEKQANAPVARTEDLAAAFANQYAEFNAIFDPIATAGVFQIASDAGITIVLASLDITHSALSHQEHAVALRSVGNRVASTMADFIEDVGPWDIERFGRDVDGNPMVPVHDATTSTALLHPELFHGERASVRTIAEGAQRGKTEIMEAGSSNVIILSLPRDRLNGFHAAFQDDMHRYGYLQHAIDEKKRDTALDSRSTIEPLDGPEPE